MVWSGVCPISSILLSPTRLVRFHAYVYTGVSQSVMLCAVPSPGCALGPRLMKHTPDQTSPWICSLVLLGDEGDPVDKTTPK